MNIEALYKTIAPRLTNWLVSSGSQYHEACDIVQVVAHVPDLQKRALDKVARLMVVAARSDKPVCQLRRNRFV